MHTHSHIRAHAHQVAHAVPGVVHEREGQGELGAVDQSRAQVQGSDQLQMRLKVSRDQQGRQAKERDACGERAYQNRQPPPATQPRLQGTRGAPEDEATGSVRTCEWVLCSHVNVPGRVLRMLVLCVLTCWGVCYECWCCVRSCVLTYRGVCYMSAGAACAQ